MTTGTPIAKGTRLQKQHQHDLPKTPPSRVGKGTKEPDQLRSPVESTTTEVIVDPTSEDQETKTPNPGDVSILESTDANDKSVDNNKINEEASIEVLSTDSSSRAPPSADQRGARALQTGLMTRQSQMAPPQVSVQVNAGDKPPKLKSLTNEALTSWCQLYKAYESTCLSNRLQPEPMVNFLCPVRALTMLKMLKINTTSDLMHGVSNRAMNHAISAKMASQSSTVQKSEIPGLIKMANYRLSDPVADRLMNFLTELEGILRNKNIWIELNNTINGTFRKKIVDTILELLKPRGICAPIINRLQRGKLHYPRDEDDFRTFFCAEVQPVIENQQAVHDAEHLLKSFSKDSSPPATKNKQRGTKRKHGQHGTEKENSTTERNGKKFRGPPCLYCLDKGMQKKDIDHVSKNCPNPPSNDEKQRIHAEYRVRLANYLLPRQSLTLPTGETQRKGEEVNMIKVNKLDIEDNASLSWLNLKRRTFRVTVDENYAVEYDLDSGAKLGVVISGELADKLKLKRFPLSKPAHFQLAMHLPKCSNIPIPKTTHYSTINLTFETQSVPIHLENVKCLIADAPLTTPVLVGDTMLRSLGIDVHAAFAAEASRRRRDTRQERGQLSPHPMVEDAQRQLANEYDDKFSTDIGLEDPAKLDEYLENMLQRMKLDIPDLTKAQATRFQDAIYRYKSIWRSKLGNDPPAKVPPMKVHLKPDHKLIKAPSRRYTPLHREFMRHFSKKLVDFNLATINPRSRYSSAVHIIHKVPTPLNVETDFRWVVDYKRVNTGLEPIHWPLPRLDVVTEAVAGAKYFFSCDFNRAYWQLPLHPDSREYFSMITDQCCLTPNRVPQGSTDAVMYCQQTMQSVFAERLYKGLVIWIDDILGYAKTIDELADLVEYVFHTCAKTGLKLNPKKTNLISQTTKFCGRIFSKDGIEHDPERIAGLTQMSPPTNAAELAQFIGALLWMTTSIMDLSRKIFPLRLLLEECYKKAKSRKSKAAEKIPVQFNDAQFKCFDAIRNELAKLPLLAHPNPTKDFVLVTDASTLGWGAVLFQIQNYDPDIPIEKQSPEPLAFLSGIFNGPEKGWSIPEKEAYAVVAAVDKLDYLLLRQNGFILLTDHRNLEFIFNPAADLKTSTRHKIGRWALSLMGYKFSVHHIPGKMNVWADLLSRWALPPEETTTIPLKQVKLFPMQDDAFAFPTIDEIKQSQARYASEVQTRGDLFAKSDGTIYFYDRKRNECTHRVWVPEADEALLLRLLIVAHNGRAGHTGINPMFKLLHEFMYTQKLRTRVQAFCKECLLCKHIRDGYIIPRPLGRTLQATAPHQILHLDYLFVGTAHNGWKYILVLKDNFSHFVELVGTHTCSAEAAAVAVLDWFKRFGNVPVWVSDQGSHFKNTLMDLLRNREGITHRFTTPHCPWANSRIERVNLDIVNVMRVLSAEFKMAFDAWPTLLPRLQSVLNNTPRASLADRAPIELHIGRDKSTPIASIFNPQNPSTYIEGTQPDTESIIRQYNLLQERLDTLHKDIEPTAKARHDTNQKARFNQPASFQVGDFVLWSRIDSAQSHHKLTFMWRGPFRVVTTVSNHVYEIQHMIKGDRHTVHASRLKFYHDSSLNTAPLQSFLASQQEFTYDVDSFTDLRKTGTQWQIKVKWAGFENAETTWEPFETIWKDVTKITYKYLATLPRNRRRQLFRAHARVIRQYCTNHRLQLDIFT